MRKIGSEKTLEEKRKRNNLILSLGMLFLLVMSSAGFAFLSNPNSGGSVSNEPIQNSPVTDYKVEEVQQLGNRWVIRSIPGVSFAYSPNETKIVQINSSKKYSDYQGKELYLDFRADSEALSELVGAIGNVPLRIQEACYGKCEENLPEKLCEENSENNFIIFKKVENRKVYEDENCVFIEGDLKSVDAFLYRIFNIN